MKRIGLITGFLLLQHFAAAQTLTFLFRNPLIIPGPKLRYEIWLKSSNGTSRMGSVLVYNNYDTAAFGSSVVANGHVSVTKNAIVFGSSYGQNANNDNTSNRFAFSWTFQGASGTGTVIPSTGDGVLAFTVEIDIANSAVSSALTFEGSLMGGEQYLDDETSVWPVVDATDILDHPLPIQLASFSATINARNHVRLDWRTISEINNYGFEVQRKRVTEHGFETLANSFVPGHGTTNEPHDYSYTDTTVTPGQWHYRLRQIDLDGTVHFSEPITSGVVTLLKEEQLPTVFALHQNYPNPFNPSTTIAFDVPVETHISVRLYNLLGEEVAHLIDERTSPGRHRRRVDAAGLASGVYIYRVDAASWSATGKMVVLK